MMDNLLPIEKTTREILIKKNVETDPKYGKNPDARSVEELIEYGIININKPQGPTSHQISDYVKKILRIKKAGHSGTLDPNVTGCLPVALDKATRVVQVLLKSGKEYVGLMHLHKDVTKKEILDTANSFIGKISQLPPKKSAVKRQIRQREVYYIQIIEIRDRDILFRIGSEAGFYIRKFCYDFGIKLGTKAHMQQLIRTKVGYFSDKGWHSLYDLKDAYEFYKEGNEEEIRKVILPFEYATLHLPGIWVLDSAVNPLCHGVDLANPGISKINSGINKGDLVAMFTLKNELIAIGKSILNSQEILEKDKGIAVSIEKTFMPPGIYPVYKKNH